MVKFRLNLIQSEQPNIPFYKKLLMILDYFRERSVKTDLINPRFLLTPNRKDIEYRIKFLEESTQENFNPSRTLYYKFIEDDDKGVILDAEKVSKDFVSLYEDIKKNGIMEPLAVAQYSNKEVKTRYILKGKKFWKKYSNEHGYQLINGAHRLAVAITLDIKEIPVNIYHTYSFEIPDYTNYIKIKESEYKDKIWI